MTLYLLFIFFVTFQCVISERISSKLDFGDSPATSHAAISINQGRGIYRPSFHTPELFSSVREVPCVSNDCKNNDSASATADVVVHVKTHVNVPNVQNGTQAGYVPDVPIIVGGRDIPQYDPFTPAPNFKPHVYPSYGNPDVGFNVINTNPIQAEPQFNNYPMHNGIPFNNYNNRYAPELHWYPQGRQSNVQNPIEFTKIFKNTWTSNFPNDWSGYTNKRHTHPNPEWVRYPQTVGLDEFLSKWSEFLGLNMNKFFYSN